jgi:peptidoglycan/LPS O-acetylase OafA/YrhL
VSIQYLRGVAAIMIVIYHIRGPLEHLGYRGRWAEGLASGVDIFFVISGFVMWISTAGRRMSPLEFYRRRILRIVPLYWVMTGVVLVILLLAPGVVRSGELVPSHIFASFLFLPAVHPVTGHIQPLLIPGWTLNEEMYFYAIFGVCLLLPAMGRIPAAWVCLLTPVLLCRVIAAPDVALRFFGHGVVLDFGLGLALGAAIAGGMHLRFAAALTMFLAGAVLMGTFWNRLPHVVMVGLPALAVVAGLVAVERAGFLPEIPALKILGDASYSLYLTHTVLLSALDQLAVRVGLRLTSTLADIGFGVVLLLISLAVGVLAYRWIETPLSALAGRRPLRGLPA